jgi:hypothetical protein
MTGQDDERPSSSALQLAVQQIASCVRPITIVESGSGAKQFSGSAVIFSNGRRRVAVTAEHVVAGPERKLIGMSPQGSIEWPASYTTIEPIDPVHPSPDLAFIVADVDPGNPFDIQTPLPVSQLLPGLQFEPGHSVVAVGFPASRAKSINAQRGFRTQRLSVVGDLAAAEAYTRIGKPPDSFIAMEFRQDAFKDEHGRPASTAHPRGMSGGAMFAAAFVEDATGRHFSPRLIGILIEFHGKPDNVLVAARIDCLLDATGTRPEGSPQRYRAVDV